jgi:hypothetical protein
MGGVEGGVSIDGGVEGGVYFGRGVVYFENNE